MSYFLIIIITLLLYFIITCIYSKEKVFDKNQIFDLNKDGFFVYKNMLSADEINQIKSDINNNKITKVKNYLINNSKLKLIIKNTNFIFQDYIWVIKKSSVHTCHRDNNGDFFNKGQQYPSYTVLVYLEDMDKCLGVIPTSHKIENKNKYNINLENQINNIVCNKGDVIIFNANLIHVGILNETNTDYLRVQMKISHKKDIHLLDYYQNFNKILNKQNDIPFIIKKIQKNMSCSFPLISDLTQSENIKSSRGSDNGVKIGHLQKLFSYLYYGDSKFYDLPNVQ